MSVDRSLLRAMTESVYALQSVRIVTGNRIVQAWYRTHGVEPGPSQTSSWTRPTRRCWRRSGATTSGSLTVW